MDFVPLFLCADFGVASLLNIKVSATLSGPGVEFLFSLNLFLLLIRNNLTYLNYVFYFFGSLEVFTTVP